MSEIPERPERTDKNWPEIERLFADALERPSAERAAYLEEACSDRPELRQRLEALLASHEQCDSFLAELDADSAAALLSQSEASELAIGERVGSYRVLGEVGRGGMGVVYLAERADGQFEQRVALKLVKRGMDSGQILRRFLNERQILARLEHPNIARLLDGGITEDGQPYFAMEFVEGEPFHDYCDQRRLDIPTRLRLFQEACRAVQYAHAGLVIHRDLKPSNILVTPEGELKLLDFGIAKLLLEGDTAEATVLTHAGIGAMTPEYAAPEQVRGETLTTATDVYALGVMLYELLTGSRPYRFTRGGAGEVIRAICETEPERPSISVGRTEQIVHSDGSSETITPQRVSRVRDTQPERLRRRLSGDLDTVVLKALRKEPERRYPSASALAEDLERHLTDLPVEARPDTVRYRASKFVRRHWLGMTAAAVVAVALLTGSTLALWQAGLARGEARKAEAVREFVSSLFQVSDPNRSKGEAVSARELLDAGAARIETELAGQPEIQAQMMTEVGEAYQKLGLYEPAQPLLEQALGLRRAALGEEHEDVAASLHDLALLLQHKGDYAAAEPLYRETLAMQRKLLGREHPEVATTLSNLGTLRFEQQNFAAAEGRFREALATRQTLFGEEHPDVAVSLNDLALVIYNKGDADTAEPLFYQALAMQRKLLGPDHTDITMTLNNLALLLRNKGDYDAAEALHREALAMKRKLLGREHPSVATALQNLGGLLRRKGDYAAAEPLYREALAMRRKLLGSEHPHLAANLNNLAVLLRDKGDYAAAEPLYREALAMKRKLLGQEHPSVATTLSSLGLLLHRKGDYAAAEPLHREALAMRRKLLGPEHPRVATILNRLAGLLAEQGDYAAAEPLYREALAMRRKLLSEEHPDIATSLADFGEAVLARGAPEDAEPLLREAFEIRQRALPAGHRLRASAQSTLGACLSALGRFDEAESLLLEGYEILRTLEGDEFRTTQAQRFLAEHYERRGLPDRAQAYRSQEPPALEVKR